MTLREWSELTGILPTHPTTEVGAVSVVFDGNPDYHRALNNLEDYKVQATYGGKVIWLIPR